MEKNLILLTKSYPFGKGETFIESEFPFLIKMFKKIHIISEDILNDQTRDIPPQIKIHRYKPTLNTVQKVKSIKLLMNRTYNQEKKWIKKYQTNDAQYASLKIAADFYLKAEMIKHKIKELINEYKLTNVICYTYWLDIATLGAVLIKDTIPNFKVISRIHGYDLFFERHPYNYLPFRTYLLNDCDRIFSISQMGINYLAKRFSTEKLALSRLGTINLFPFKANIPEEFIVISCSSLISLKRVHLIIQGLAQLQVPFKWFHIGDGVLKQDLENLAVKILPKNSFQFLGYLPNTKALEFYYLQTPSLFINTSETEGIPVSIMEAMSFGIPCIGTKVGGVVEVIESGYNGFLLSPDPTVQEIVDCFLNYFQLSETEKMQLCQNARQTWEEKYNAEQNYSTFSKELLSL